MTVTRDENFPPEAAALVDAFSRCCDGHSVLNVTEAATNFFIMALHNSAKAEGLSLHQAESRARRICKNVVADLANQWHRTPKPDDVPVNRN